MLSDKYIQKTPIVKYTGNQAGWESIWIKDETKQITGAFKFRGNIHKLAKLSEGSKIVTASTGNHGLGLACAAQLLNHSAIVFIPATTPKKKSSGIQNFGAEVIYVAGDYDNCESEAREYAAQNRCIFISSFDDEEIIEGHQKMCMEIDDENINFDAIFIPVGGGGLISACLKHWKDREIEIIGVEAEAAPAMKLSLETGSRVRIQKISGPAEGLLVRQVGQIPFQYCLQYKPQIKTVNYTEMEESVRQLWTHQNIRAEVAGAASLAAAMKNGSSGKMCLCIVSGGNIDDTYFNRILNNDPTRQIESL